jgi:ABC-type dipeptide/oligopeptide/nickel transport system permease component
MLGIVGRRLAFLALVVVGVTFITFLLSHVLPGDPARLLAGPRADAHLVAQIRAQLGLDQPLPAQYAVYLGRLLHLDLGNSVVTGRSIAAELLVRVPATLELMLSALAVALVGGILLGVLAAVHKDTWIDQLVRGISVLGISMPTFWLGLLLIQLFYGKLGLLPGSGRIAGLPPPTVTGFYLVDSLITGNFDTFRDALSHLILPAATLAIVEIVGIARLVRSSMIDVLGEDYVLVARASGLKERVVIFQVALRNALIPFITLFGLSLASILYGSVVTETVFAWPGTGKYVVDSIFNLDFPVVMAFALMASVAYVFVNLAVDLTYLALDPQIREVG